MMADLARFVQDHPYQAVYLALGVLALVVANEVRHLLEKRWLRRALVSTPAAPPPPSSVALPRPAPSAWGTAAAVLVGLGILAFAAPALQGQAGSALSSPGSTLLTTGTYQGSGTGPLGSTDFTLTLDASSGTPSASLFNHTLGTTYGFQGTITPESGGVYLSGALVRDGVSWGSLKAHVSTLKAEGVVSAGPLHWTLDLRR